MFGCSAGFVVCCFEDAVDGAATDAGQCVNAVNGEAGRVGLPNEDVAPLDRSAPSGKGAFSLLGAHRHELKRYMHQLIHSNLFSTYVANSVWLFSAAFATCSV